MTLTAGRRSRRIGSWTAGAAVGMTLGLAGCSDDAGSPTPIVPDAAASERSNDRSSTASPAQGMQIVDLAISGDTTETIDEPVEVGAGETFALQITADAASKGAIHVHSTPQQTFEFEGGTSTFVMSIDHPGLVEVEAEADHSGGAVLVRLKVV